MPPPASSGVRTALKTLAIAAAGAAIYLAVTTPDSTRINRPAPPWSLPDTRGRAVSLEDFRGRVVLLDFFATWCHPCLVELPELRRLHRAYQDRGFTLVGVSMDDDSGAVAPFARENEIPYPLLLTGGEPLAGYPVTGLPTAYLIDRRGVIVRSYGGPKSFEVLARDIEPLLLVK